MRRSQAFTVDGHELVITQWGAREGAQNMARCARMFGPAIMPIVESAFKAGAKGGAAAIGATLAAGVDLDKIAGALRGLDGADLDALILSLQGATVVRLASPQLGPNVAAVPLNADDHFAGSYMALLEWLASGLAFNFMGFTPSVTNAPTSPKPADASGQ